MYISIKDGKITPVDELPDLSNLHQFNGLHYCDSETPLPNGRKSLNWQKCELFTDEEVQSISDAATVLERLFDNLNRLDAAKDSSSGVSRHRGKNKFLADFTAEG